MDVQNLSKMIQLYLLQNLYGNDGQSSSYLMFETILKNALGELEIQDKGKSVNVNITNNVNVSGTEINSSKKNISQDIMGAIKAVAQKYNMDEDLIKAVIKQESSFKPGAVSKAGAMGLMQLMPQTAKSLGVDNPFDVLENIDGGTRYLKKLIDSFDGSSELALAAYNGGIGRMNRLGVDSTEEISKMPGETKKYVEKVMKAYEGYKKL